MEKRVFNVVSATMHDGELVEAGGNLRLTRAQFDALKLAGAVEGEWISDPAPTSPDERQRRAAAIRDAVAALGEAGRNKDGKPNIVAVEKAVGFNTDRTEIDAALAAAS